MRLKSLLTKFYHRIEPWAVDRYFNVRTSLPKDRVDLAERPKDMDPTAYLYKPYLLYHFVLNSMKLRPDDVFFDIGCGTGRPLFLAARRPVKKCIGVELDPSVGQLCRQNADRLRGKQAPIEVRVEDAVTTDFSEGTFFYLFNPFNGEPVSQMIERIYQHTQKSSPSPRHIRILYHHPVDEARFASQSWLKKTQTFHYPLTPLHAVLYESRNGSS